MKDKYITIPRIWVSKDNLESFNIPNETHKLYSDVSKIVFVSYLASNDCFVYSTHLSVKSEEEHLCNSEAEFLEKVQEAKLMNIISQ